MPGIRTSRIRHAASCILFDPKNASAEEKPCARNPADRIRFSSEPLRLSSSSTIEIRGIFGIESLLLLFPIHISQEAAKSQPSIALAGHLGADGKTWKQTNAKGRNIYSTLGQAATTFGRAATTLRQTSRTLGFGFPVCPPS
jgi:hypothetical protein